MISKRELLEQKVTHKVHPERIEKDYVLGWLLDGIYRHTELADNFIFKGGTCIKKCFLEKYRFSEDLDFSLKNSYDYLKKDLDGLFWDVAQDIQHKVGIEFLKDWVSFDVWENDKMNTQSAEVKIRYRGPLKPSLSYVTQVKIDISFNEPIIDQPQKYLVHHPYSDNPDKGIFAKTYSLNEVIAEKLRALSERIAPRDLYDIVNIFERKNELEFDETHIKEILAKKCAFKEVDPPSMNLIQNHSRYPELFSEWKNMLGRQLPEGTLGTAQEYLEKLNSVLSQLGIKNGPTESVGMEV